MTKIDRPFLARAKEHIDTMLAQAGKELGVDLQLGTCRYTPGESFTFKLEGNALGEDGNAVSREAEDFKRLASSYGLKTDDLGKEFVSKGETFKITGLNVKAKKYPIQADRESDGASYRFAASTICRFLGVVVSAQG